MAAWRLALGRRRESADSRVPRPRRAIALAACGAALFIGIEAVEAEPLPLPRTDFALKAKLRSGASLDLAHSRGLMRAEMTKPGVPAAMVGFIDLAERRITLLVPAIPNMAVETDIPLEYSVGALAADGTRTGQNGMVAGEACDLWQVASQAGAGIGPTTLCITADGITLRTEAEIKGKTYTVYEVTQLSRDPQTPDRFRLPPGLQVMKVPKGKGGLPPALLGLGLGLGGGTKPQ